MLGLVSLDLVQGLGLVLVVSGDWFKCGVMWMWWTHGGWCVVLLMVSRWWWWWWWWGGGGGGGAVVMVAFSARFVKMSCVDVVAGRK